MMTDRMLLLTNPVSIINKALDEHFDNGDFKDEEHWYKEMFLNTSETRYFAQNVTDKYGYIDLARLHDYDEDCARGFLHELLIVVAGLPYEVAEVVAFPSRIR